MIKHTKNRIRQGNRGMTLAELIVVLSIFSILATVVIFNYQKFLSTVTIKALANDMALRLVDAQKSAAGGRQNTGASATWKPSYGVYFNTTPGVNTGNKVFYYFADMNQNKLFDAGSYACPGIECLEKITLNRNNTITDLRVVYRDSSFTIVPNLNLSFTRPNYGATIRSTAALGSNISYAQITVAAPDGSSAIIRLYASGRIQIN